MSESYKDLNGNWLYPTEIEKLNDNSAIKKTDKSKVIIGPPESMSKSKKNTVDPEIMIKKYGADAVRWFILSDSPPEKDVQWSDVGVNSSSKFLQKFWNLNNEILNRKNKKEIISKRQKFNLEIEKIIAKIDQSIKEFKFNVSIALFYETFRIFNNNIKLEIDNKTIKINLVKVLKTMIPFVPHIAFECLEKLGNKTSITWPEIIDNLPTEIKFAIQVNGKTRDIIKIEKDLPEVEINKKILNESKTGKILKESKIKRTIFVKNKIINYII